MVLLSGATAALGIFQYLAESGVIGSSLNFIAPGYVTLVLAACAYRWREW
jgi:hypothetical protein